MQVCIQDVPPPATRLGHALKNTWVREIRVKNNGASDVHLISVRSFPEMPHLLQLLDEHRLTWLPDKRWGGCLTRGGVAWRKGLER